MICALPLDYFAVAVHGYCSPQQQHTYTPITSSLKKSNEYTRICVYFEFKNRLFVRCHHILCLLSFCLLSIYSIFSDTHYFGLCCNTSRHQSERVVVPSTAATCELGTDINDVKMLTWLAITSVVEDMIWVSCIWVLVTDCNDLMENKADKKSLRSNHQRTCTCVFRPRLQAVKWSRIFSEQLQCKHIVSA